MRMARENIEHSQPKQQLQYKKGERDVQFCTGDLVLRRTHSLSNADKGFSASLNKRWEGPLAVRARVFRLANRLQSPDAGYFFQT